MSQVLRGGGRLARGSQDSDSNTAISVSSEFSAEEHLARLFGEDIGHRTSDHGPLPRRMAGLFNGLGSEDNPEIFFQDLFQIGQKAEEKQDLPLASTVFAYVSQNATQPSLRKQAEARLAGITGQGGTGAGRLEHLSRSWMDHAFDPAALAGMSAAGLAFQSGKLFTMARLWGRAAPPTVRLGGALGGFAVEVPAFVATTKGASASLGREVDWSTQAWKTELIGGAMVLGALKLSGFASGSGVNKLHGVNPVTGQATRYAHWLPTTRTLGTQTGMLGGIMTGHSMEATYFGHETPDGANNLLDSLATLLQFNVAGKLTPMMVPRAHALSQQLGVESHRLSQTRSNQWLPDFLKVRSPMSEVRGLSPDVRGPIPAMATANGAPPSSRQGNKSFDHLLAMSSTKDPKLGPRSGRPRLLDFDVKLPADFFPEASEGKGMGEIPEGGTRKVPRGHRAVHQLASQLERLDDPNFRVRKNAINDLTGTLPSLESAQKMEVAAAILDMVRDSVTPVRRAAIRALPKVVQHLGESGGRAEFVERIRQEAKSLGDEKLSQVLRRLSPQFSYLSDEVSEGDPGKILRVVQEEVETGSLLAVSTTEIFMKFRHQFSEVKAKMNPQSLAGLEESINVLNEPERLRAFLELKEFANGKQWGPLEEILDRLFKTLNDDQVLLLAKLEVMEGFREFLGLDPLRHIESIYLRVNSADPKVRQGAALAILQNLEDLPPGQRYGAAEALAQSLGWGPSAEAEEILSQAPRIYLALEEPVERHDFVMILLREQKNNLEWKNLEDALDELWDVMEPLVSSWVSFSYQTSSHRPYSENVRALVEAITSEEFSNVDHHLTSELLTDPVTGKPIPHENLPSLMKALHQELSQRRQIENEAKISKLNPEILGDEFEVLVGREERAGFLVELYRQGKKESGNPEAAKVYDRIFASLDPLEQEFVKKLLVLEHYYPDFETVQRRLEEATPESLADFEVQFRQLFFTNKTGDILSLDQVPYGVSRILGAIEGQWRDLEGNGDIDFPFPAAAERNTFRDTTVENGVQEIPQELESILASAQNGVMDRLEILLEARDSLSASEDRMGEFEKILEGLADDVPPVQNAALLILEKALPHLNSPHLRTEFGVRLMKTVRSLEEPWPELNEFLDDFFHNALSAEERGTVLLNRVFDQAIVSNERLSSVISELDGRERTLLGDYLASRYPVDEAGQSANGKEIPPGIKIIIRELKALKQSEWFLRESRQADPVFQEETAIREAFNHISDLAEKSAFLSRLFFQSDGEGSKESLSDLYVELSQSLPIKERGYANQAVVLESLLRDEPNFFDTIQELGLEEVERMIQGHQEILFNLPDGTQLSLEESHPLAQRVMADLTQHRSVLRFRQTSRHHQVAYEDGRPRKTSLADLNLDGLSPEMQFIRAAELSRAKGLVHSRLWQVSSDGDIFKISTTQNKASLYAYNDFGRNLGLGGAVGPEFISPLRTFVDAYPAIVKASEVAVETAPKPEGSVIPSVIHGREEIKVHRVLAPDEKVEVSVKRQQRGRPGQAQLLILTREHRDSQGQLVAEGKTILTVGQDLSKATPKVLTNGKLGNLGEPILEVDVTEALIDEYVRKGDDANIVHTDKAAAQAMGLPDRILHGLATLKLAERALLWENPALKTLRPLTYQTRFEHYASPGDRLSFYVTGKEGRFEVTVLNQNHQRVLTLDAKPETGTDGTKKSPEPPKSKLSIGEESGTYADQVAGVPPSLKRGMVGLLSLFLAQTETQMGELTHEQKAIYYSALGFAYRKLGAMKHAEVLQSPLGKAFNQISLQGEAYLRIHGELASFTSGNWRLRQENNMSGIADRFQEYVWSRGTDYTLNLIQKMEITPQVKAKYLAEVIVLTIEKHLAQTQSARVLPSAANDTDSGKDLIALPPVRKDYGRAGEVEVDIQSGYKNVLAARDRISPEDMASLTRLAAERPDQPWLIAGISDGMGFQTAVALIASGMMQRGLGVFYEPDSLIRVGSEVHLQRLANAEGLRIFANQNGLDFPVVYQDLILADHAKGDKPLPENIAESIEELRAGSEVADLNFFDSVAFARFMTPSPGMERLRDIPSIDNKGNVILANMKSYSERGYRSTLDTMGRNHGILLNSLAPYFGPQSLSFFLTWAGGSQNYRVLKGIYGRGSLGDAKIRGEVDTMRFHLQSMDDNFSRGRHRVVRYPDFVSNALFAIPGGGSFGMIARSVLMAHGVYRDLPELASRTFIEAFDGTHNLDHPLAAIELDSGETAFMPEVVRRNDEFVRRVTAYRQDHPEWTGRPLDPETSARLLKGIVDDDYKDHLP